MAELLAGEVRGSTRGALTGDDLRMLVKGPTPDERALAAHKLCRRMDRDDLTAPERAHAHEILRVMAADAAEPVRRALAVTLKSSPLLPRDVALRLARDVETIAVPVLSRSPSFADEDLTEIIRRGGGVRQAAIARRPALSAQVTGTLVEHGVEAAVRDACANDKAQFFDASLHKVLHRFTASNPVLEAVAYRRVLPVSVTETLIDLVGGTVREHLATHQALSAATALRLATDGGERAAIDLLDQAARTADIREFVVHLKAHDRLTGSLLLRGLAQGHMTFFEWALAELAQVPHHRTWLMIHDAGPLGLRAICERAGLPARLFAAFRAGVDTFHALSLEDGGQDPVRFQERMMQRFLTQATQAPKADVDYLLARMDRLAGVTRGGETRQAA